MIVNHLCYVNVIKETKHCKEINKAYILHLCGTRVTRILNPLSID